jgi:hypothetical protein
MSTIDTDNMNTTYEMDSSNNYSNKNNNNNNAKQVIWLLDALRMLGDENASLLEQVEEAKMAQLEAKAAKEEMKWFQMEYQKRFNLESDKAASTVIATTTAKVTARK